MNQITSRFKKLLKVDEWPQKSFIGRFLNFHHHDASRDGRMVLHANSGVLQIHLVIHHNDNAAGFANTSPLGQVCLVNDLAVAEDGWMHLAPYGDFPGKAIVTKPDGTVETCEAIQRLDEAAVTAMVNEFHSTMGSVKRFLRGRKLFVGHPDVPGLANDYPDKEPRGIFTALEARSDGLYGKPVLTDEGAIDIESKTFKAISSYWLANEAGTKVKAGQTIKIFRPAVFRSAGLTNRPNLPVRHLPNEGCGPEGQHAEKNQPKIMDKIKLIAWLATCGVSLANEATDDQVLAGLARVKTDMASLANERDTAQKSLSQHAQELNAARTAFANERKARVDSALDTAITAGRITAAERPVWATRMEANFANELAALEQIPPKVKTQSTTGNLGERKAAIANVQERGIAIQSKVAEIRQRTGMSFEEAYNTARKKNPQLFNE